MMNNTLHATAVSKFRQCFGAPPAIAAFAPGRIEVLGNHTDYNEGFVLSAAINLGTCFLVSPAKDQTCRLVAGDIMKEAQFRADSPAPSKENSWANYVKGVVAKLPVKAQERGGFNSLFLSDLPLAAGLSSSAALEMSAALALASLYGLDVPKLDLAKIGQKAEHEFAGVKCGLLDQISSLFGREDQLVMTDFRSLAVRNIPFGAGQLKGGQAPCFVVCNTGVKHTLVDSEYNERRARCEDAAKFFKSALKHPVTALRDVSWEEWQAHSGRMDPTTAKRAAHVIGENTRVVKGEELLAGGRLAEFGKLMLESHDSSRKYFENSCGELDFLVDTAGAMPAVAGARLSGGGFGGCALILVGKEDAEATADTLSKAYEKRFGRPCAWKAVRPSGGARLCDI